MAREAIHMEKRRLGRDGPWVSCLGLGCMGMSWLYGATDDTEAIATIHRAIDRGITFFDTAEVYGPYTNERLLGAALRGRRDGLIIATKFGFRINDDGSVAGTDSRPETVRARCEASLRRLGVDVIDLFYQHRVDRAVPIEDTVGAMADLVREGKVRWLGLSEASAGTLRRAAAVHSITALQSEWSLWERTLETEVVPAARALGVGLVPFSPLGRGFLTGRGGRAEDYPEGDYRRREPRLQGDNFDRNQGIVAAISAVAAARGATAAQVALAWLLARGTDVVPIPGTKRRPFLEENIGAAGLALTADEIAALERAAPVGGTAGPRYGAAMLALVDR
jgi:aryl-alcohol dehydrogenase-like predicted oxidoreductase